MSGWIGAWGNAATVTNLTVTGSEVISVNTSTDALRITQTGTGNVLVVEDSANPDSTPLIIKNDGSMLLGRTYSDNEKLGLGGFTSGFSSATSAVGINNQITVGSTQTNTVSGFSTYLSTQASSFNLTNLRHYSANQGSIGASSSISNQIGYLADASLINASYNYGFYSSIPAGSNRFNFYANGTADNYFSGNTYTASGTTSMTSGFFYIPSAAGAPSGVPTAISGRVPMYYDTTNNNFYIYNGAWKKVLLG